MSLSTLASSGGYLLIATGTFFEGEVVMLAAGVAACAGLLSLPLVIAAGMTGVFASDTVCFLIGRFAGGKLAKWFPKLHARLDGIFELAECHDQKLLIFFQFFPGLCTVTPMAFGMTKIPFGRFMLLDFIGNAIWTLSFGFGGYLFGSTINRMTSLTAPWVRFSAYGIVLALLILAALRMRKAAARIFAG